MLVGFCRNMYAIDSTGVINSRSSSAHKVPKNLSCLPIPFNSFVSYEKVCHVIYRSLLCQLIPMSNSECGVFAQMRDKEQILLSCLCLQWQLFS